MICFKPKNENLNLDIKLYYFGTGDCEHNFSWGPGIKDHYKLHYIHKGNGTFKIGNKTYNLSQGEGFLICPNVVVSYEPNKDNPWDYSWVAFNGINAEAYLNRANLNINNPTYKCHNESSMNKCFNTIFESIDSDKCIDFKSLSAFYSLLSILVEESTSSEITTRPRSTQDNYIKQAIEFIDTNYSRKITVEEIATYVGVNRKYLSKLFSDSLNESPQNFLINFRINKACDLLINTHLSINEISNSIGYSDPFLFSKVFKKFKGVSPKFYRENNEQTKLG